MARVVLRPLAPDVAYWLQRHPEEAAGEVLLCSDPQQSGLPHLHCPRIGPLLLTVCCFFKGLSFVLALASLDRRMLDPGALG